MKFFTDLINNSFNKKVYDYVQNRDKLYKVKIISFPDNAHIMMNNEKKSFGAYKNGDIINYQVGVEGYSAKCGTITVSDADITENVILESI